MENVISIPKPCHEDWEQMLPEAQGRHCLSCSKTVVDFSTWSNDEILSYLATRNQERVCGRFNQEQVNAPNQKEEFLVRKVMKANIPFYRKLAAIIIFSFGLLTGSDSHAQKIVGKIASPRPQQEQTIRGEVMVDTTKKATCDTVPQIKERPSQIMGMIAPYKPPKVEPKPPIKSKEQKNNKR